MQRLTYHSHRTIFSLKCTEFLFCALFSRMKITLDSEDHFQVLSLVEFPVPLLLAAFMSLCIWGIYRNVPISLVVIPGCLGNGSENVPKYGNSAVAKNITAAAHTNPLSSGPEQHSLNYLGKRSQKEPSFIVPERSAIQSSQESGRNGIYRGGPEWSPLCFQPPPPPHARWGGAWKWISLGAKQGAA